MDFQAWLDDWADSILAGDYETFRQMSVLPFDVITPDGSWTVTEEAAYRKGYDAYLNFLNEIGATMIARSLRHIDTQSDTAVVIVYDNHILRDSTRLLAPSGARASLVRTEGRWCAHRVEEIHTDETQESPLPTMKTHRLHKSHSK